MYRVRRLAGDLVAENSGYHMALAFGGGGVTIGRPGIEGGRSTPLPDAGSIRLRLLGVRRDGRSVPVRAVQPSAIGQQVTYRHPGLDEWYVNGPVGLEQGFTVVAAAGGRRSLDLELGIAGGA